MTTLKRYDGTQTVYSTSDMEQLLAHLSISNTAGCSDGSVFFWAAAPYVIIVDLAWIVNRRLSELFQVAVDPEFPFNIAFVSDSEYISLYQALLRSGYAGIEPLTEEDLSRNYMALYESASGGADAKVLSIGTGSAIVASSGNAGSAATLKGIRGGQGILLSESGTDIEISANATPIATIGTGLSLIDPSSTALTKYIASLAVSNGLTLNRNAGVVSIGLGSTLTVTNLQNPDGLSSLTLSNSGVRMVLSGFYTMSGEGLGGFDINNRLVLTNGLQCSSFKTTRAESQGFYVQGDDLAIPSGTQFKALSDSVAASQASASTASASIISRVSALEATDGTHGTRLTNLETSATSLSTNKASNDSVTALTTRVATLESSDTSQTSRLTNLENTRATTSSVTALTTRVSSVETSITALTTRVSSVETTQSTQTIQLNNIITAVGTNTSDITSLKTRVSTLETATPVTSTGSGVLPFAVDDVDARRKAIAQFTLYRNTVRGGIAMRQLADSAYQMTFAGSQSYQVQTFLDSSRNGWTLEWWAYIPRLFQQSMVSLVGSSKSVAFGLSGGGAFNVATSDNQITSLGQPETNTWYLFGAQQLGNVMYIYMLKNGVSGNSTLTPASINASGFADLGVTQLIVGRDPQNYSFQGSIACSRLVGAPLYPSGISLAGLRTYTGFPLDASPSYTQVVLDGSPLINKVNPTQGIVVTGTPSVSQVTVSVDNWVPL